MNKFLSENEKEQATIFEVDMFIRTRICAYILKRCLEDEEFRKKLISRLKGGD